VADRTTAAVTATSRAAEPPESEDTGTDARPAAVVVGPGTVDAGTVDPGTVVAAGVETVDPPGSGGFVVGGGGTGGRRGAVVETGGRVVGGITGGDVWGGVGGVVSQGSTAFWGGRVVVTAPPAARVTGSAVAGDHAGVEPSTTTARPAMPATIQREAVGVLITYFDPLRRPADTASSIP